jgi:predicted AlkP superfamily phosphohydrolase/phosphomutase
MEKAGSKSILREILVTGLVAGVIYFLLNLALFFPSEQLILMASGFLKFNLFMYSFSIWLLGFTALSAALFLVTAPLGRDTRRRGLFVLRYFIIYLVIFLVLITGYAVWREYSQSPPFMPKNIKIGEIKKSILVGTGIAVLLALGLSLVSGAVRKRSSGRVGAGPGGYLYVFAICLVYVIALNLPVDYARLGEGIEREPSARPRIVILGLDAGSWNVVLPFLERGDLPAFRKMMDEGTYGYFNTYGQQYTPPSWTCIATGKKEENHGIHTFSNVSSDWKGAPLWSIMSGAGRRVGVVNWVNTWPPFKINGGFISSVLTQRPGNVYFSDDLDSYRKPADEILSQGEYGVATSNKDRMEMAEREMSRLRQIDNDIMSPIDPDFLAYVYYATDKIMHFFWDEMSPELFTGGDFSEHEKPDEAFSDAMMKTWLMADGFLAGLMERYGDDACYLIVSDHGARPVTKRQVLFDMNGLLEELGYLTMSSGEVDYKSTTCYAKAKEQMLLSMYDLKINPSEYTDGEDVDLKRYSDLKSRIVHDLRSVEFKDSGIALFEDIQAFDEPGEGKNADIRVFVAKVLLMGMPPKGEIIVLRDREVPVTRLLSYHPWTGRHRSRGIVLARGPAIEHRYSGAWTIDEPYTRIFRYSRGILKVMDRFSAPLRKLHLVDEITTLDIAPTLLYFSGLPVALDMDGRILTEILDGEFTDANQVKTVPTYRIGEAMQVEGDPAELEKLMEKLKSLGYIQ